MRLSSFPFVTVRLACRHCPRRGRYRLARLAERYGAELTLLELLAALSADCPRRAGPAHDIYRLCGAHFTDLTASLPPDEPLAGARKAP